MKNKKPSGVTVRKQSETFFQCPQMFKYQVGAILGKKYYRNRKSA